jgi:uncharacterized membrane protein YkvA (DUF1232 family)
MIRTHPWYTRWREAARNLKRNIAALYFAVLSSETPWYAKVFAVLVVAYALSPIDLIPDFIPVLGYLDDLILLPLGIWVALQLIPPHVMIEARCKASDNPRIDGPIGYIAAAFIIAIYALLALWLWLRFSRPPQ